MNILLYLGDAPQLAGVLLLFAGTAGLLSLLIHKLEYS